MIEQWVQECREGKTRVYAEIVKALRPRLLSFLYRMAQNREIAEELGQEAFLKAFQQLPHYNCAKSSFSTWLFTIARNVCIDHLRKQKAVMVPEEEMGSLVSLHPTPRDVALENEMGKQIARAVSGLAVPFREVFVLKEYQNMDVEDIARITGTTVGTVKSRLFRARLALQDTLAPLFKKADHYYG